MTTTSGTAHHPRHAAVQAQRRLSQGRLELAAAGGRITMLGALEARLWELCDGSRDVATIAAMLSAELGTEVRAEAVWRALDGLADAGLMQGRAAPPASPARLDRRGFLRRTWPGLAIAGAATVPGVALAADVEADSKANDLVAEQSSKATEQDQKAAQALEQGQKAGNTEIAQKQASQEQGQKATQIEQANKLGAEQNVKSDEQNAKSSALEQSNKADARQQEQNDKIAAEQLTKSSGQEQDLKAINAELHTKATEQQEKIGADQLAEQAVKASQHEMLQKSAAEQARKGNAGGGGGGSNPMPAPQTLLLFGAALAALAVTRYADRADKAAPATAADDQAAPGGK